jgi:DNA-binding transcriptional regulator YiaG
MKKKAKVELGPIDYKALARDIRDMNDYESGKLKKLPRGWGRTNYVAAPSSAWIRAVRRRFKLDLHEFGGLVGLQAADVKAWERGKEVPNSSATRLLGLLALKPHLVKFMQSSWKDDEDSKVLGRKAWRNSRRLSKI